MGDIALDGAFVLDGLYLPTIDNGMLNDLTVCTYTDIIKSYEIVNCFGNDMVRIPRYFLDKFPDCVKDMRTEGEDIVFDLLPQFSPRDDEQIEAINAMLKADHGYLAARVGFGKTYLAINAMSQLKKKTLILAHKENLLQQWKEKIVEYTGIDSKLIGNLGTATKKPFNKPIYLSSVQTLAYRQNNKEFKKKVYEANFGLTIYDECHTTSAAPKFSESTKCIYSKKIFGLSATPFRSDGLSNLLRWNLGECLYDNTRFTLPVYVILIDIPIKLGKSLYYIQMGNSAGTINKYCNHILKTDAYMNAITNILDSSIDNNRNILGLSSLISALDNVKARSKNKDKINIIHASIPKNERDLTSQSIVATYGSFKDGMDVPALDTLLFLTPITGEVGLIQSIGRVTRQLPGKDYAVIFDIGNSEFELTEVLRRRRIDIYKEQGFRVLNAGQNYDVPKILDVVEKTFCKDKLKMVREV